MQIYNNKKIRWNFPHENRCHSNSHRRSFQLQTPSRFHSQFQIGVLFPFPLNSNSIPTGNRIPTVSSLAWCTHVSGGCAVAVAWLTVATGSRHAGWCGRLTTERPAGKLTRRETAAHGHRGGDTVVTFRTRQAALLQTDRATRYGPNSVTSICCGFAVHTNPQQVYSKSNAYSKYAASEAAFH